MLWRDESVQLVAPAKINLSLKILGQRPDDFHEIETLMTPISLCDRLTFGRNDSSNGIEFQCNDASLPQGRENLVVRAAERFRQKIGLRESVRIELEKRIPHGAGLGGGSSDAATTLIGLNQLCGSPLRPDELTALAAEIGSDVPFFIVGTAARCLGRGEIVTTSRLSQHFELLLAKPDFGVATAAAYARWSNSRELAGVDYAPQVFGGVTFENDLERPVFEKYPFLARMKTWLREQPQVGAALLSGSGSTVFAALRADADPEPLAQRMKSALDPKLWTCLATTA
jgi:4-diphosphocytidyl-2-C-methyl-D-erythritol kinase